MEVLEQTKKTTVVRRVKVKLDESEILQSIIREIDLELGYAVESITFRVPGGGDWSNMDIDLKEMSFDVVLTKTI